MTNLNIIYILVTYANWLAFKKFGVLVCLRKMIHTQAKLQLYKSAILPNLMYCDTVWHFCKASDARKLERCKSRHCVKHTITGWQSKELLTQTKLPSLGKRCLQDILILIYKVKNSLAPEHICNIFYKQFKNYNLNSSGFPYS